jgi:hypothetical protein
MPRTKWSKDSVARVRGCNNQPPSKKKNKKQERLSESQKQAAKGLAKVSTFFQSAKQTREEEVAAELVAAPELVVPDPQEDNHLETAAVTPRNICFESAFGDDEVDGREGIDEADADDEMQPEDFLFEAVDESGDMQ